MAGQKGGPGNELSPATGAEVDCQAEPAAADAVKETAAQ